MQLNLGQTLIWDYSDYIVKKGHQKRGGQVLLLSVWEITKSHAGINPLKITKIYQD
jgi:hypothetical protein